MNHHRATAQLQRQNSREFPFVVASDDVESQPRKLVSAVGLSMLAHLAFLLALSFAILPFAVVGDIRLTVMFQDEEDVGLDLMNSFEIEFDSNDLKVEALNTASVLAVDDLSEIDIVVSGIAFNHSSSEQAEPAHDFDELFPSGGVISTDASSVESAVDSITTKIIGELEKGDLLVVWLLDASHSLVDDRKRVAARLGPFFKEIAARRKMGTIHQLRNAVVSFGKTSTQRVAPTEFGKKIVGAVEKMHIDSSGNENVFAAVSKAAAEYRATWRDKRLMIIVWTDESGDDVELLESTIADCRKHRASVSVVGPSSVLGAETGLHSYIDPKSKTWHQLPITRGPDSAFPERVELGYWFHSGQGFPRFVTGDADNPSWYGGPDMKGIASGFSPYSLTRLAVQTGGFYTMFDRAEDGAPFDRQALQAYAPDYDAVEHYFKDVSLHPLRRAVVQAVKATKGKGLGCPELMLFVVRDKRFPAQFERPYFTPRQFSKKLRTSRRALDRKRTRMMGLVERALVHVSKAGQVDQPLEYEYREEGLPRWRAWYDLTRGRLLATSVRLEEYRLVLESVCQTGTLQSTTNHVLFVPGSDLRSDAVFQSRGEEAERLLRRCVQNNPDTPWAYLAQRELDRPLGINAKELSLSRTPSIPRRSNPSLPRF